MAGPKLLVLILFAMPQSPKANSAVYGQLYNKRVVSGLQRFINCNVGSEIHIYYFEENARNLAFKLWRKLSVEKQKKVMMKKFKNKLEKASFNVFLLSKIEEKEIFTILTEMEKSLPESFLIFFDHSFSDQLLEKMQISVENINANFLFYMATLTGDHLTLSLILTLKGQKQVVKNELTLQGNNLNIQKKKVFQMLFLQRIQCV